MKQSDRAKQFLPFDALKGFFQIIKDNEYKEDNRIYLSDELLEELDVLMHSLKRGDLIEVKHYEDNHYILTTGMLGLIDIEHRRLQVVKKKINFDDIVGIQVLLKNN